MSDRIDFVALARSRRARGDIDGAVDCWRLVLESDPSNPEARNALGNFALAGGRADEAVRHFERAAASDPGQPAVLFNLAAAQRALGLIPAALESLQLALAADPEFVQARFQLAVLYEEAGDCRSAAEAYRNFVELAPESAAQDPRFTPLLDRAHRAIARDTRLLESRVETMMSQASPRIAEAVDLLLGRGRVFRSEPTFLNIPRLASNPFLDRDELPWIAALERHTERIRAEVCALLREGGTTSIAPYIDLPAGSQANQWAALNRSSDWSALHLWKHGTRLDDSAKRLPSVELALESVPLLELAGRAPNVFLSWLAPGAHIPPHNGVTNARLTVHLPLIIPEQCAFRVGNETRSWQEGQAWVFDDTIEHEAWNRSDKPRLILIFDIWNPQLSLKEQDQISAVLSAYDQHYGLRQAGHSMF